MDISCIQAIDIAYNAINYIERIVALVDGVGATHTDLDAAAWCATHVRYADTCQSTLHSVFHTGDRLILEGFAADGGYRTCKVALLDHTITNDDNFLKGLIILYEFDLHNRLGLDCL